MKIEFNIEQSEAIISENFTLERGFEDLASFKTPLDLSFIPPLQRRRLSNCASCAFFLYEKFHFKAPPLLVFSSFAGEINNCFAMLNTLIAKEPLSPNAFSLSVLNATPALLSIQKQNHNEIAAISANPAFEYAIITAYTRLLEQKDKETFVMSYFESLSEKPQFLMLAAKISLNKPNFCLKTKPNLDEVKPYAILSELDFLRFHQNESYEVKGDLLYEWSKI